jgi:hypothetical protein
LVNSLSECPWITSWVTHEKKFMVHCNKDIASHKKTAILPSYMNETAFCQSRYPERMENDQGQDR